MITHTLFRFHLVTVSYGYIVHLVAKTNDQHILRICPTCTNTHPYSNLMQCVFVFPITYYHFATDTHTSTDVSEFTVAMSRLIQVHEVHVHCIPRNFLVELSMQMQQRFLQLLQTVNPHFCRRESMHPSDDTDTFLVVVGSFENSFHFFGRVGSSFVYHFYREFAGVVQPVNHFIRVCVYCDYCVTSVQELCSCYKPYFILIKCVHNVLL